MAEMSPLEMAATEIMVRLQNTGELRSVRGLRGNLTMRFGFFRGRIVRGDLLTIKTQEIKGGG